MLKAMSLVDQYRAALAGLRDDWLDVRLRLTAADEAGRDRAASVLGAALAGLSGGDVRFTVSRRGEGANPDNVARLLARLDEEGVSGTLELLDAVSDGRAAQAHAPEPLAPAWDAELRRLPGDWSDVFAEVSVDSSDYLDNAALLLAPVNPASVGTHPAFRFRAARRTGYGAAPAMVRRCLERLDEAGFTGSLQILHALSDSHTTFTQGPSWHLGGKIV
jgi:hypothetical protein